MGDVDLGTVGAPTLPPPAELVLADVGVGVGSRPGMPSLDV